MLNIHFNFFSRYIHFQDSCYKIVSRPLQPFLGAQTYCKADAGNLVVLNNQQELSWFVARLSPTAGSATANSAWFGGVDEVSMVWRD